jgi:hypothetical protein
MTRDELTAAARHAAALENHYPDTATHPPQVTEGDRAATVLMADQRGGWIVCVHLNNAANGDWYVTGDLPHGSARTAAAAYAAAGL